MASSILFFTPYGQWRVHNQLDAVVAASLRQRGCRTTVVTCDGLYQPCAIIRADQHDTQNCADCQAKIAATLGPCALPSVSLGSLITGDDIRQADAWVAGLADDGLATACHGDLPVGEWALSTVMTSFRISLVSYLADPRVLPVHRRFLRDTLLTFRAINRVMERERIDALFIFNTRFYPYRAAYEAAQRRGIRTLAHERGRVGNSFSFFEGDTCHSLEPSRRLAAQWQDIPLQPPEIEAIHGHFLGKLIGQQSHWPAFYQSVEHADIRTALDIPQDAELIGLFTTSPDEFAHLPHYRNANRQFELIENVSHALTGTNRYLVVRHHPAIAAGFSYPTEVVGFYNAYGQALSRHPQTRILMPSDRFASYALFPFMTAAVAPFSSIALETLAFGIPTLVSDLSDSHFDERFVLKSWSAEAVATAIDFITSPAGQLGSDQLRRFYRQSYSHLFRVSVELDVIGIKDYFEPLSRFDRPEELAPGRDPALDRVCGFLLSGRPIHPDPGEAARQGPATEETNFIDGQLAAFDRRRAEREPRAGQPRPDGTVIPAFAVLIDTSAPGEGTADHWRRLPHARDLTISSFAPVMPADPLGRLRRRLDRWRGTQPAAGFDDWLRGLDLALARTRQDHVLVTTPLFQFHDASVTAIGESLHAVAGRPAAALVGWVRDPGRFHPIRIEPDRIDLDDWRALRGRLGPGLRTQDILSLFVLNRHWLRSLLARRPTSAEAFEATVSEALCAEASLPRPAAPVFLLG